VGSSPTRPTIDSVTCALIQETLDETMAALAAVGVTLAPSAFLFSNDPAHSRPWNPDWVSHRVRDLARAAGARYTAKAIGRLVPDGLGSIPRGTCPGAPRRMSARGALAPGSSGEPRSTGWT